MVLKVHIFNNIQPLLIMKYAHLTNGLPRPSCLSIISALARMIFPPWVIMDCLSHVTKSGRFSSYTNTKARHSLFVTSA